MKKVSIDFHGRTLSIEVGKMAKQTNGSALVQYGDTMVLVTAVYSNKDTSAQNFFPLSVDYFEKYSAAGKIPGGFFKREGRQTEREILTSRLIDRPLRPLFPENYRNETQLIATVFSFDKQNEPDTLAVLGASAALHISEIPFMGPVAAVRVGRVDGKLICNPTVAQQADSDLDMTVACSKDAVVMVEGAAKEVSEEDMLAALKFGFESAQPLITLQEELRKAIGKEKMALTPIVANPLEEKVRSTIATELAQTLLVKEKTGRYKKLAALKIDLQKKLETEDASFAEKKNAVANTFEEIVSQEIRNQIVNQNKRIDDRNNETVRAISIEVGLLPRTHGSALFTRGETQALVTTTLGTSDDEQIIDSIHGNSRSKFMLHYNFPPYSVGEVKPMRGPARREIGHGALAYKAIQQVLPEGEFPYTIRVISDVLESHGSSSMATVCGATLSLMDAGVPIKAPVAGIAMGLIKEGEKFLVLSDISGDEDHIGDMDFKVAGTKNGVTAVQMDIKVTGISWEIFAQALKQAKDGRLFILDKMTQAIETPRDAFSVYAPRIETMQIKQAKIREVIGQGGKVIRSIVEKSGAKVEIEDSGIVTISSDDAVALEKAKEMIRAIVAEPEVGAIYKGHVTRVMEYGVFVEVLPGQEGLCHVSQLYSEEGRIENIFDHIAEGDEIAVKLVEVDNMGRMKLSEKEAVEPGSGLEAMKKTPPRKDNDRNGGDRDRGRQRR
jgi:polyribonucleotide nucleotidyltransferase